MSQNSLPSIDHLARKSLPLFSNVPGNPFEEPSSRGGGRYNILVASSSLLMSELERYKNELLRIHPTERRTTQPHIQILSRSWQVFDITTRLSGAIQLVESNWIPKGVHIMNILRACCDQRYSTGDIEHIFFNHGDIVAILALFQASKTKNAIFTELENLHIGTRIQIARDIRGIVINPILATWIESYDRYMRNKSVTSDFVVLLTSASKVAR